MARAGDVGSTIFTRSATDFRRFAVTIAAEPETGREYPERSDWQEEGSLQLIAVSTRAYCWQPFASQSHDYRGLSSPSPPVAMARVRRIVRTARSLREYACRSLDGASSFMCGQVGFFIVNPGFAPVLQMSLAVNVIRRYGDWFPARTGA